MEYCNHHKDDPQFAGDDNRDSFDSSRKRSDDIDEWDKNYMTVDNVQLLEVILAAKYLDITALVDLGCKTVANMIKGKVSIASSIIRHTSKSSRKELFMD